MLGTREDAEDAVQEAWARAYRALGRYEPRDAFGAWLTRILVNQCRTAATRRGRRLRRFVHDDDALATALAPVADAGDATRPVEAVQQALDGLEPLLREAF